MAKVTEQSPLDFRKDLQRRKDMLSVKNSSLKQIWNATDKENRICTLLKFLRARLGIGKLSSSEFIRFGFCKNKHSQEEISRFLGKRAQLNFHNKINGRTWHAVAKNKLLFETLMRGASLATAETIAVYDRKGRGEARLVLSDEASLRKFLEETQNYPMFCKPTTGVLSIGSFRIDGLEKDGLNVNGSHIIPIAEVIEYIQKLSPKGYLFQRVLIPHKALLDLNGTAIASVRFLVLNDDGKISIDHCSMKLPSSGEVADNFWRNGSILCAVDPVEGKVFRAVINNEHGIMPITVNPVTKEKLKGFLLPQYEQAKMAVLSGAALLSGIRVQSWDVAFTDEGPVLLEVNDGGDLNLIQIATGEGIYANQYKSLITKHV